MRTPQWRRNMTTLHRADSGRYHIETWGCQMNLHDSEKLAGALERNGYVRAGSAEDADVILLNTCSIREKAAEKVFSELGRLKQLKDGNPNLLLGVCGCVAQQEGEKIFGRAPYVDFVLGPRATSTLDRVLADHGKATLKPRVVDTEYRKDSIQFPYDAIRREGLTRSKAYVTVIEGCNHRCTYCIVPTTRGREICRPMSEVIAEVSMLADQGVHEIEFLGQTVNAYRDAEGNTLAELLIATARRTGIHRIRFTTSHPAQMTDRLMDAMGEARPSLCRYLHLPVQSGSSDVLKQMKRGYDRETYLEKIAAIRRRIPDMRFGTDIIVGFPGETEAQFQETLSLMQTVPFDTVYSFTYSERPGTRALEFGDPVPLGEKMERLHRLQSMQNQIQEQRNQDWVGTTQPVLIEGRSRRFSDRWTGRTEQHRVVNFTGAGQEGSIRPVEIQRATAFSLYGVAASGGA